VARGFEKTSGRSTFNVLTIAVWESPEAVERAVPEVRAYYDRIGFDPIDMCARGGLGASVRRSRVDPGRPP
jgi:hypothetical protein